MPRLRDRRVALTRGGPAGTGAVCAGA